MVRFKADPVYILQLFGQLNGLTAELSGKVNCRTTEETGVTPIWLQRAACQATKPC